MNIELKKVSSKTGKPGKVFSVYPFNGSDFNQATEKICNLLYMQYVKKFGLCLVEVDKISKPGENYVINFVVKPAIKIFDPVVIQGTVKE